MQCIRYGFLIVFLLCCSFLFSQTLTQTIKGKVVDADTGAALIGANVILMNVKTPQGTITDEAGYFKIEGVPVGRASLQFTYLGYEDFIVSEVLVGSAKEVELTISLTESLNQLDEVLLKVH